MAGNGLIVSSCLICYNCMVLEVRYESIIVF